jgi:hypothetical protein
MWQWFLRRVVLSVAFAGASEEEKKRAVVEELRRRDSQSRQPSPSASKPSPHYTENIGPAGAAEGRVSIDTDLIIGGVSVAAFAEVLHEQDMEEEGRTDAPAFSSLPDDVQEKYRARAADLLELRLKAGI